MTQAQLAKLPNPLSIIADGLILAQAGILGYSDGHDWEIRGEYSDQVWNRLRVLTQSP